VRQAAGEDVVCQVTTAYRLALGRPPTGEELLKSKGLAGKYGLTELSWVLLNASEFLYVR
jgi:hypothetical protein